MYWSIALGFKRIHVIQSDIYCRGVWYCKLLYWWEQCRVGQYHGLADGSRFLKEEDVLKETGYYWNRHIELLKTELYWKHWNDVHLLYSPILKLLNKKNQKLSTGQWLHSCHQTLTCMFWWLASIQECGAIHGSKCSMSLLTMNATFCINIDCTLI